MPNVKRTRRKDARPEEIIDAALAEFAEVGYSAASMARIAARAGIARSTIYLYYADKEALISAAFEARLGEAFAMPRGRGPRCPLAPSGRSFTRC